MKARKMIMLSQTGDILIFWHGKNEMFLETKFGIASTKQVGELIDQIAFDLDHDILFYIGDL